MRRILLLAVGLCSGGCSLFFRSPQLDVEGFAPVSKERRAFVEPLLNEASNAVKTFRGSFETTVKKSIRSTAVRQIVVFEHPDHLRIELFVTGLNRLGALVTVAADQVQALFPDDQVVYLGSPSPGNIRKLLNVPLGVEEVMYWVSGGYQPGLADVKILHHPRRGEYLVTGRDGTGRCVREILETGSRSAPDIHPRGLRLRALELTSCDDHRTEFRAEYKYPSDGAELRDSTPVDVKGDSELPACGGLVPTRIEFWLPEEGVSGEMSLENARCNSDLTPRREQLFHPRIPPGVEVRLLDQLPPDSELNGSSVDGE